MAFKTCLPVLPFFHYFMTRRCHWEEKRREEREEIKCRKENKFLMSLMNKKKERERE